MTNNERDKMLFSLADGLNNTQITLNKILLSMEDFRKEVKEEFRESERRMTEKMTAKITESEERMTSKIAESEERMTSKIAESEERMTGKIAESEERMTTKIAESEERTKTSLRNEFNQILDIKFNEQREWIVKDVTNVFKTYEDIFSNKFKEVDERIDTHDKEIAQIKLILAN